MKYLLIPVYLYCFLFIKSTIIFSQNTVTVFPKEFENALKNPLKGFRPDLNQAFNTSSPYTTIVRHYIKWSEIEANENDDYTKIIEYSNELWKDLPNRNIKVIPRIYVDWNKKIGNEFWPNDILEKTGLAANDPNLWRTQIVKDRLVSLIYKMGKAWNNDHRVAWIQTGLVGYWGEQENPVGVDEEDFTVILGNAFHKAFPNKKLVVRNQNKWDKNNHKWGVYWDSFAHPGQENGSWANIRHTNSENRYLNQVVEGEVAYDWGENAFDPIYGGEPTITLGNNKFTDNMIDVIRELHATGLGWISSYKLNAEHNTNPEIVKANADRIQKEFGYRFLITEFSSNSRTNKQRNLHLKFKIKNIGSAPFYENWPLAVVIIDESSKKIISKEVLKNIDITSWKPGNNYNYDSKSYLNPAKEFVYNAKITIPKAIPKGQYLIGLSILEPNSQSPGVFFAIDNFIAISQSQPLLRVGVDEELKGSHHINFAFDNPLLDDARYYSLPTK